jgi:mono/diheme cytochrome c family protein
VRRFALIAAFLLSASVLAAGCQSQGVGSATPKNCTPDCTVKTVTYPITPAFKLHGDAAAGKTLFTTNCGGCHTLADAGTSGTIGPNLDEKKPDYRHATAQVTNGGGQMPPFKDAPYSFTAQQIADVAAYVVTSTGGTVP